MTRLRNPLPGTSKTLTVAGVALVTIIIAMIAKAALNPVLQTPEIGSELNPKFSLLDQNGRPFTDADLQGKPRLMIFGYTSCPVICPTLLSALAADMNDVGQSIGKANYVFVTVDPEHDTPPKLKSYLAAFSSRFIGLTGSPSAVFATLRSYGAYQARRPEADGRYSIDHTSTVLLIDGAGRLQNTIGINELGTSVADQKLRRLLAG